MGKMNSKVNELLEEIKNLKEASKTWPQGWDNTNIRVLLQNRETVAQDELFDLLNQGREKRKTRLGGNKLKRIEKPKTGESVSQ